MSMKRLAIENICHRRCTHYCEYEAVSNKSNYVIEGVDFWRGRGILITTVGDNVKGMFAS